MRINKYIAGTTGMSRRAADEVIARGNVTINGQTAQVGQEVSPDDVIRLDDQILSLASDKTTVMLNKPAGYVCSRNGQGSPTIYELLPDEYHHLKPVGRLDKESSGLLLLTNDGQLAQQLTHPSFGKEKVYQVELNKPLTPADQIQIEHGVKVEDYLSQMHLHKLSAKSWRVTLHMGKNRQIRKTFAVQGYQVIRLRRIKFGPYELAGIKPGEYQS